MYKVKVNQQSDFNIDIDGEKITVDDQQQILDIVELNAQTASILYQNKSFNTEVISVNHEDKTCRIKVNGTVYTVSVEDQYDQLLKQLGMDNLATNKVLEVKAPMPGLVLNVMVKESSEIKKGDNLLILEAMKMENILKSPTDGTIKKVLVVKGDKVEKNQILIQFR